VAIHELGHAIISELMRPGTVSHITIAPRGDALGFVRQIPESDRYLYTLDHLKQQINVALAGSLAEELHYGNRSTGAQNDFMQASSLARTLVKCGLSRIGIVDEENLPDAVLDTEVRYILAEQDKITRELLKPFKDHILEFAHHIVEEESINGTEFRGWLDPIQATQVGAQKGVTIENTINIQLPETSHSLSQGA
jgi:ATP-dependent Zn protease